MKLPISLTLLLASCQAVDSDLESDLRAMAARHAPRELAIAYLDLHSGRRAFVNSDVIMHAASTMKVPVMIELFRRDDAGELDLDGSVTLRNSFRSIVDGSTYSLTSEDDSDAPLYAAVGSSKTIRELMHRMITKSSNLATNSLIELTDATRVQRTIESLGTTRMQVLRGVEDTLAYRAGRNNTATAEDLMRIMAAIANHTAASPAACDEMIRILKAQVHDDLIPSGLPQGTVVAHKTGWITGIHHDMAIVDPSGPRPYVLVVLTRGFADSTRAAAAIGGIARRIHSTHARQ